MRGCRGGCWGCRRRMRLGSGGDVAVDVVGDEVADEDVVDEFLVAAVDAGVAVVDREADGEVPQSVPVALVVDVVAAGADLGSRGPGQDLGGGGLGFVVEADEHGHRSLLAVTGEQGGGGVADGDGFGDTPVERVGAVAGA